MNYNIDSLLNESLAYKDKSNDLDNALKYAMIAASLSYSPRADVCCCIGEIYLSKGNIEWAKFWYERALQNMSMWVDEQLPDADYFTIIPMLKLCFICHKSGDIDGAKEYNNAVLLIDPENEIALSNKKEFENSEKNNSV
jgi:tetratricopeptide (TPR) repeat protein